jgi:hypothetical protein
MCLNAECHNAKCLNAECHYAKCLYAECHYADCHYAECFGTNFVTETQNGKNKIYVQGGRQWHRR